MDQMKIYGLYIHIPFCRKICPFCSFAVHKNKPEKHSTYLDFLKLEYNLLKKDFDFDFSALKSVYFGGGTPSLLTYRELENLKIFFDEKLKIKTRPHYSIELNPEDVNLEYAKHLKRIGISRVSLGVQSFNKLALKTLGRQHSTDQSLKAIECLHKAGFEDINLDLIFAYPEQTIASLKRDLEEFANWQPTHLSAYALSIEPKTAIFRLSNWSKWQEDKEELIFYQYQYIADYLGHKELQQYEVSNFAKIGFQSPQNLINWKRKNYLGLGMGAHSLVDNVRWGNYKRWIDYRKSLEAGKLPRDFLEKLNKTEQRDEEIMINLRLSQGLNLEKFQSKYQLDCFDAWQTKIETLIENNYAKLHNNWLTLSTKGLFLADEIAADLASVLPQPSMIK